MNYAKIVKFDIANGPGIRTTLFVTGCSHHCPFCHNPETWNPYAGNPFTNYTLDELDESLAHPYIAGLTLSGGDPLYPMNINTITDIIIHVREKYPEKSIWLYTGYEYESVKSLSFMNYIDVLVDGEFEIDKKDISLIYCGSTNQRVIDVKESLKLGKVVLYKD